MSSATLIKGVKFKLLLLLLPATLLLLLLVVFALSAAAACCNGGRFTNAPAAASAVSVDAA
jgi:hypothetical protein